MRPGKQWRELRPNPQPRFPGSLERSEAEWKAIRDPAQDLAAKRRRISPFAEASLREASAGQCRGHESSGRHCPSRRAWRAEPRGRSSSPAGGHIDTGRPGRWPRVEASRPPRGLRRLSVRRPSDLGTGGGVKAGRCRSPVGAALAPHHHRACCPSSSDCCFIIVGLFPHHRRGFPASSPRHLTFARTSAASASIACGVAGPPQMVSRSGR